MIVPSPRKSGESIRTIDSIFSMRTDDSGSVESENTDQCPSLAGSIPSLAPTTATAAYTAKEAAEFVRLGACLVAWPPDEVWVDPLGG